MDAQWTDRLRRVEWIVATGEYDTLIGENRAFAELLRRKGLLVHAEFWPGVFGHDWPFWRDAIRRFI
jgi:esterase/lipase superfamily enzyme